MPATFESAQLDGEPAAVLVSDTSSPSNGVAAARRLSWAQALLAMLALASFALVFIRLFGRWRVTPRAVSHRIAILGLELSYPVANVGAIAILALALLGALVAAIVIVGATRELRGTRRLTHRLSAAHLEEVKGALVIDDPRPRAFCAGLLSPRVYVTTGALTLLDEEALEAVLIHERHHARRRDPMRLAANRVFARALFFLPGMGELVRRRETLGEIDADAAAINEAPSNRAALARAMLSFADSPVADGSTGVDPIRVDHLLGERPTWRLPMLMLVLALFLLVLLGAFAVLAGREAAGSASLAPPFLSAQPCVVMLALIPAGLVLAAIAVLRTWRTGAASARPH